MAGRHTVSPPETSESAGPAEAFDRLRQAARDLPDIAEGTSYGTPALRVRTKFLCRVKDPDTVAVMCPLEEKELLISAAPDIYFETDHYKGWPVILIRVHLISPAELRLRLERAFTMQAPKTLLKAWRTD